MNDPWEIHQKHLTYLEDLGEGAFGRVFKAILSQPLMNDEVIMGAKLKRKTSVKKRFVTTVAVKALKGEIVMEMMNMI